MVSLDRWYGSHYTFDDLSNRICIVNLNVFNMITRTNELEALEKHTSVIVNTNLIVANVIQIKSRITKCVGISKKIQ